MDLTELWIGNRAKITLATLLKKRLQGLPSILHQQPVIAVHHVALRCLRLNYTVCHNRCLAQAKKASNCCTKKHNTHQQCHYDKAKRSISFRDVAQHLSPYQQAHTVTNIGT